jgi:hypothetical protein
MHYGVSVDVEKLITTVRELIEIAKRARDRHAVLTEYIVSVGGDATNVMADRARLHQLVDALPARDLDTADHVLRGLLALGGDPALNALLDAPEDDEPTTEEDILAEAAAGADIAAGRVYSHEEVKRILLGKE